MDFDCLLNFNVKTKNNEIKAVYMHTFEQIASLYMYAYGQLVGDSRDSTVFKQQMRFVGAIKGRMSSSISDEKRTQRQVLHILQLVDSGAKALDILDSVKAEDALFYELDAKSVERVMEDNSIMFPRSYANHPYSIGAMHSIINNPLPTFQLFLHLPSPEELLCTVIKYRLGEYADRDELLGEPKESGIISNLMRTSPFPFSYAPLSLYKTIECHQDVELTLDLLLKAYSDGKIKIDTDNFSDIIERSIDDVLQDWSTLVLSSLFLGYINTPPMIESIIDSDMFKNEGVLKVNTEDLKTLCLLGQADQIGEMLSVKIKENYITDNVSKDELLNKAPLQLKSLAKWYRHCKMGYISEVSQVPPMIASILYTRFEHSAFFEYVTLSQENMVDYSGKVDDLQKLVTAVIDRILYKNGHPEIPRKVRAMMREDEVKTIDDYLKQENDSTYILSSHLMAEWAVYDKKKTRDRFKRPLKNFNRSIVNAGSKIKNQQQKSIHHHFPIANRYPLPFWAIKNQSV